MSLAQDWRDFICDPASPGRFLSSIGRAITSDDAPSISSDTLASFISKLKDTTADATLLAEVIDLTRPQYENFCDNHLGSLLDALANENIGRDLVVGPALRGRPKWDRTILARRTGTIPPTHFVSRVPARSFELPENSLVRWLVASLQGGIAEIGNRLGRTSLPPALEKIEQACLEATAHPWFGEVPVPEVLTGQMIAAGSRHRLPAYRAAAALAQRRAERHAGTRSSRWLATLDVLRANWLSPVSIDDVFELYALTFVLDIIQFELGFGEPKEYGLIIPQRSYVALFEGDAGALRVYFDQSPSVVLGVGSVYAKTVQAHEGVTGVARRPDVLLSFRPKGGDAEVRLIVEVKDSESSRYVSDSIYKAFGYVTDFGALWPDDDEGAKVILLFPSGIMPTSAASTLNVQMFSSMDRLRLADAMAHRFGLTTDEPPVGQ